MQTLSPPTQWHLSSSQVPPHKSSIIFPNSTINCGQRVLIHGPMGDILHSNNNIHQTLGWICSVGGLWNERLCGVLPWEDRRRAWGLTFKVLSTFGLLVLSLNSTSASLFFIEEGRAGWGIQSPIPWVLFLLKCHSHLPTLSWEPPHTRADLKAHYLNYLQERNPQEMWVRSPESLQSRAEFSRGKTERNLGWASFGLESGIRKNDLDGSALWVTLRSTEPEVIA